MSVPLSDTRLAEIRERVPSAVCPAAHPAEADKRHVWVIGSLSGSLRCSACHLSQGSLDSDEAVLLREIDRLRFEFREAMDNYHGAAAEAKKLRAESESRRQAAAANAASAEVLQKQINKQASELDRLGTRLNKAEAAIRAVETVKCWTNEDGRRFVFAKDLAEALGYTPATLKES